MRNLCLSKKNYNILYIAQNNCLIVIFLSEFALLNLMKDKLSTIRFLNCDMISKFNINDIADEINL
jgi:uncharacterized membrane protein